MYKRFAAAVLAVSITSAAMAEEFNSAKFLTYSKDSQISYITTSLAMAATISPPAQSKCISEYTNANQPIGYPALLDAMAKYPQHHPTGIIAAVVEKSCGTFELAKR